MTKVAVVGHGFVGKAVSNAFVMSGTEVLIVDPAESELKVSDLPDDVTAIFVCVPTPVGPDGSVDGSIVESVVGQVVARYGDKGSPILAVKSTLTPDVLARLADSYQNFAFNPEFLTERNALLDFIEPPFHVVGTRIPGLAERLYDLLVRESAARPAELYDVSIETASLIKYGINNFLALKVAFFNELHSVAKSTPGADWAAIRWALSDDPRIGESHTQVPGPDGKYGFGGACFIKDTAALVRYGDSVGELPWVMEMAASRNAQVRLSQGIDDRERVQGVKPDLLEKIAQWYAR